MVEIILDHLPADYGRILEWKYMEGFSVDEIAERLGVSMTSVQSRLARARDAFRAQYAAASARIVEMTGVGGGGE
jgi:RNA polymerase sigma-70 factor, ECF subfamily